MSDPAAVLPERKRGALAGRLGWIAYDMAGGPYFNVVKIFVFAAYFANVVVGNTVRGQTIWAMIEGASGLMIALLSALVGSAADAYGPRKPLMAALSLIVVAGLIALWTAEAGSSIPALGAVLVATAVAAELSFLCHGSLLMLVAHRQRVGLLSGLGYSSNYLGTLLIFILWLTLFGLAKVPALGLDRARFEDVRIIGPLAGLWFLLCAVPFFLFTPDEPRGGPTLAGSLRLGLERLKETIGEARHYANIMRYLIARMVYFDGLVATFTFIGIYATGTFGWHPAKVGVYGLIIFSVIVFAAAIGGAVDDRIGSKRTVMIGLIAVAASVALALSIGSSSLLFFFHLSGPAAGHPLPVIGALLAKLGFTRLTEQVFILCGIVGGIFMGPTLASSRTLLARLAPEDMMAEFFGLFTLSGKATSFLAPFAIALLTGLTGSQRAGIAAVLFFLIAGFALMLAVKEERAPAAL